MINSIILGVIGGWQVIAILVVVLLLFGGKKIPELMKGLGKGIKEFKDGIAGDEDTKGNSEKKE
jgi:sec-independent protein translocase protein TatA